MSNDTIVMIVLALLSIINAWVLVVIRANGLTIKELREADNNLAGQLGSIRELVAGSYLKRDEFQSSMRQQTDTITSAVLRLESKLDQKADK